MKEILVTKEMRDLRIELIPNRRVHIKSVLDKGMRSRKSHPLKISKEILDNLKRIWCLITLPSGFNKMLKIRWAIECGDTFMWDIDDIIEEICDAYDVYDEDGVLADLSLDDLWIESLILKYGKIIEVHVKSVTKE